MLKLQERVKVYLYIEYVDFRKAINGLSSLVADSTIGSPASGNLVIFYNKNRNKVKVLFWDRNGFVLYYKCLDKNKFKIPNILDDYLELTKDQLDWLLAGLDFQTMNDFEELNYSNYY